MPAWAGGGRRRCMAIRPAQRWGLWAAHRCQGAAPDTLQAAGSAGTALAQTVPHCAPGREPLLCRPARATTRSMGGLEALGQRIAVAVAGAFRHTPPTRVPARSEWRWSVTPRPRPRPAPVHLSLNPPAPAQPAGRHPTRHPHTMACALSPAARPAARPAAPAIHTTRPRTAFLDSSHLRFYAPAPAPARPAPRRRTPPAAAADAQQAPTHAPASRRARVLQQVAEVEDTLRRLEVRWQSLVLCGWSVDGACWARAVVGAGAPQIQFPGQPASCQATQPPHPTLRHALINPCVVPPLPAGWRPAAATPGAGPQQPPQPAGHRQPQQQHQQQQREQQ